MSTPEPTTAKLVYEHAQQFIMDMINGPDLCAGDRIPSERELAEVFDISRMTIRKAIDRLVDKGFLIRKGTSGTFIPSPVIMRPIDAQMYPYSISDMVQKSGGVPGSKLLLFEKQKALPRIAQHLNVNEGDLLIVIRRLRLMDEIPFCVETTHLPADRLPGLTAADLIAQPSLYSLLESRYNIEMGAGQGTISVSTVTADDSLLLKLRKDAPSLILHALTKDKQGCPIEYLTSVNHPQLVMFETAI